jgi:hypothetical protein
LRFEPGGVALGALGFFVAVDEGLKPVLAFPADVLEDGHAVTPDILY